MKNNTQKLGGIAALLEAIIYIFGFVFLFILLEPTTNEASSGLDKLKFIVENKVLYQTWIIIIYVVFGILLVPLTIAINERFTTNSLIATMVTPIFGFIWSGLVIASGMIANVGIDAVSKTFLTDATQALASWRIIQTIQDGIGGGVEVVGGLWVLLISLSALKASALPRALNYLGLLVGGAGILTIIPGLKELGIIFGLLQIVWFAWIGFVMIKN